MWLFKKKYSPLPKLCCATDWEIGMALLDAFRAYGEHPKGGRQQVCQYCGERGGFEMRHHPDCIVGKAAYRLMSITVPATSTT